MDPELGQFTPREGRDPFAPPAYWQVVCVGVLQTDSNTGAVQALDVVEGATERQILANFVHAVELHRPQLITFNGRSYDLPVVAARCRRHGLQFPYRTSKAVAFRYGTVGHYDVADWLSDFGAGRRAQLDVEARLIGMPGKLDVAGGDVAAMVATGRLAEVQAYCLSDVVQTHAVGLRAWLESGMPRAEYLMCMGALLAAIDSDSRLAAVSRGMNRARLMLAESDAPAVVVAPVAKPMSAADKAIDYVLNRRQNDADLAWQIDPFTQTFEVLCAAEAERTGEALEVVKTRRSVDRSCFPRRFFKRGEVEEQIEEERAVAHGAKS
jgi:hypothetical protein